ncbi:MAG TPA: hypothetical protein VGB06_01685, partial [Solirubrobacterales bacterium]
MERLPEPWLQPDSLSPRGLTCGHCSHYMSSNSGFLLRNTPQLTRKAYIYICSHCRGPNFLIIENGVVTM